MSLSVSHLFMSPRSALFAALAYLSAVQPLAYMFFVKIASDVVLIGLWPLRKARRLARFNKQLLEGNSDALLKIDADGKILFASSAVRELGGFDPRQMIGQQALDMVQPDYVAEVLHAHAQALGNVGQAFTVEYEAILPNGAVRWFETRTRALHTHNGLSRRAKGTVSSIRDVTERKTKEIELIRQANTDVLTGLPNRRAFFASLEQCLAAITQGDSACYVLAICDLDHFKSINDRCGHAAGDIVLKAFANIAISCLGTDHKIGRIGGEEFGILLSVTRVQDALAQCQNLRSQFAASAITLPNGTVEFASCSIGLSRLVSGSSTNSIFAAADGALYRAKELGRNRLQFAV